MFRNSKVLSIIPARKGSKGLPNKNFIELGNKPLIHWTIKSSLASIFIDDTLITSDSEQILSYGKSFELIINERPDFLATDKASMNQVLTNLFENEPNLKEEYGYMILLQPTSPLRTEKHINNSFEILNKNKNSDSLISVIQEDNRVLKNLILGESGFLEEIDSKGYISYNRQFLPKVFKPNGAIFIVKIKDFLNSGKLILENTIPFEMNKQDSCDIDSYEDYISVRDLFKSL